MLPVGSEMWLLPTSTFAVSQTNMKQIFNFRGMRIPILAVLRWRSLSFSAYQHEIPYREKIKQRWLLQLLVKKIVNKNGILETCKFLFWFLLVHWIDPSSIEHSWLVCYANVSLWQFCYNGRRWPAVYLLSRYWPKNHLRAVLGPTSR